MHTIESISAYLKAEFVGDGSVEIKHINNLELADTGQISFFHDPKLGKYFLTTNASAVLVKKNAKFNDLKASCPANIEELNKIVPENDLLTTAIKVAKMFGQLNLQAHAETKLRVRKKYISTLKKAIKKDKGSKISINS